MNRRKFIKLAGLGTLAAAGAALARYWPDQGFINPCLEEAIPSALRQHEYYREIWQDIDSRNFWDSHVHIVGNGDSDSGIWLSPKMTSIMHPAHYVRYLFYKNAACMNGDSNMDDTYLAQLLKLHRDFPQGSKFMLLALDYRHDENGLRVQDKTPFYVPNAYAAKLAGQHPQVFEWIASVHPYRKDVVEALTQAKREGARAIKWIPPVMAIDPASARCDTFYETLHKLELPLLTHTGDEYAVAGVESHVGANPLLLRRALEHGVKVIMAHCACEGSNVDIDKGSHGPVVGNFSLFSRMMDEPRYKDLLYGEISALTQINHMGLPMETLLQRTDWHDRLINGSDYPLPGVMPVFSLDKMLQGKYISESQASWLAELRRYNPFLFDFALKRMISVNGKRFSAGVFESRRVFDEVLSWKSSQGASNTLRGTSKV